MHDEGEAPGPGGRAFPFERWSEALAVTGEFDREIAAIGDDRTAENEGWQRLGIGIGWRAGGG
jgi:hypothetical protein